MVRANLADFKARIAYFAKLLKCGKPIVLCERNVPMATIVPEPTRPTGKRPIGKVLWDFKVPDDVWKPLSDKELRELFGDAFD